MRPNQAPWCKLIWQSSPTHEQVIFHSSHATPSLIFNRDQTELDMSPCTKDTLSTEYAWNTSQLTQTPSHCAFNGQFGVVSNSVNVWSRFNVLTQFQREKQGFFVFILLYRQAFLRKMETSFYVVSSHRTGIDMMIGTNKNKGNSTCHMGPKPGSSSQLISQLQSTILLPFRVDAEFPSPNFQCG